MAFQDTIVVDARHPENKNILFRPINVVLKTEIQSGNFTGAVSGNLMKCNGVIPGERLTVDFKNCTWKIQHKLAMKEFREVAEKIRKIRATDERNPENVSFGAEDQEGRFTTNEIATWLYHLRNLVDQEKLTVVSGKLPTEAEILKMGRVQVATPLGFMPKEMVEQACYIPQAVDSKLVGAGA